MHAASVHPEPGSNSRINCIKITPYECLNLFELSSSFFYFFVWVVFSLEFLTSFFRTILHLFYQVRFVLLLSLVVQFSMTDFAALKIYSFVIISQSLPSCQVLFLTFIDLFAPFFVCPRSRPCYITIFVVVCQVVFESFLKVFLKKLRSNELIQKCIEKNAFARRK